jgi:tetratricopeptide (TPR) repeat protein
MLAFVTPSSPRRADAAPPRAGNDGVGEDGVGEDGLPIPDDEPGDDGELPAPSTDDGTDDSAAARLVEEQRELEFQDHLSKAQRADKEQRWSDAIREYQAALRLREGDPAVLRGLGHARFAATSPGVCPRRAIENLLLLEVEDPRNLWLTERGIVLGWMTVCGEAYANERLRLAEDLAALDPGATGRPDDVHAIAAFALLEKAERARRPEQIETFRTRARDHLAVYVAESEAARRAPSAEALWRLAQVQRELGEIDAALEQYRDLVEKYPKDTRVTSAKAWIDEIEIQRSVEKLEVLQGGLPTPEAQAAYEAGVNALGIGALEAAQGYFEKAVEASPWFPRAHLQLGQVLARRELFEDAIRAFQRAAAMEPMDHEAPLALGLLYYKNNRGTQDDRARDQLGKALRLRPDLYALHYYLGELWSRVDREVAKQHFVTFIEQAPPESPQVAVAAESLEALERDEVAEEPIVVPAPPLQELRRLDPELQRLINEAYVVGAELGDWNRAENTLLRALKQFPEQTALLNELAKVVYAQNRRGDARMHWEASLAIDDAQVEVHERLGLLVDDPRVSQRHLRRAAELGSNTARYELARRLWDRYSVWEASEQLDRYLVAASPYDLSWEPAVALRSRMDEVFMRIYLATGAGAAIVLMIPALAMYRRFRGASLAQLLQRAPKSFPEVARILSLIRHEILKHNTAFLTDVGNALEFDSPDADVRVQLLASRLFGGDGRGALLRGASIERRGIHGRFLGYVEELERVARSHGLHLNLHRKDPTFSRMITAFDEVARRSRWLRNPAVMTSLQRLELARTLKRTGHVLGRRAFEELSDLIQELCVVEVDEKLLREVFKKVCQEDQFVGRLQIAPLVVEGEATPIRIFRTDLEDILVNVLRNSLRSSALYARTPMELGIALVREVDDITGLTTLAIRVRDRSPERLTSEMLRGRYVERGMGITADLLSRYDGSIAVEPEPDWEKAVVLRFFAVEAGADATDTATREESAA